MSRIETSAFLIVVESRSTNSTVISGHVPEMTAAFRVQVPHFPPSRDWCSAVLCCWTCTGPREGAHEDHSHPHALRAHPLRHGGAQAGVRWPSLSHHGSSAGAGGDGRRHHGLGRSLRPLHHPRDQDGARGLRGPLVPRQGPDGHQRIASRSRPGLPHLRPQRPSRVRAFRHRHRAVGHRGQTRRPAPVRSAGRRAPEGSARLLQPHALRQSEYRRPHLRRDGRARLQAHQAA